MKQPDKLILASGSPRRKQILTEAGIIFSTKIKPTEEVFPENMSATQIPEYLANRKAEAFQDEISNEEVILTADTIVVLENKILGKPSSYEEAHSMLKMLSGQSHEVITGVCLYSKHKKLTFSNITKVFFKEITDEQIDYYIKNYQPFDKAGAYGIQDWLGLVAVNSIQGSYYNVVGLPIHLVLEKLATF